MLDKVRCRTCANEHNTKCLIKKSSVKLNKKRRCALYTFNIDKVKYASSTSNEQKEIPKLRGLRQPFRNTNINEKYPLLGDLSRFITTGGS